jgi:MSV199 domain/T5orf172 domain
MKRQNNLKKKHEINYNKMTEINIVDLIEKNPIAKLSGAYNNKLLKKIQETFTGFEQQLFVSSFYCYLNYDKNYDFVIDFDDIWKWLGFTLKENAKRILLKHFELDVDYKTASPNCEAVFELENTLSQENASSLKSKQEDKHGGQNRQIIMLTIKCFKSLCLKAQTKKASEIHEYYLKMEEVLHKTIEEETDELRLQLEQKENTIQQKDKTIQKTKKDSQRAVEQAIVNQFPENTECIYIGTIDNTNEQKETLIKFGHTNNLGTRIQDHRKKYENFVLITAFRVQNKVEIENLIKAHTKVKRQIRSLEINGKLKTELIAYEENNFTIDRLTKIIKDIIHSKTYSIDNFNRLLKQNDELMQESAAQKQEIEQNHKTIESLKVEMNELREIIETQKASLAALKTESQSVYQNELLPEDEQTKKFAEFINTMCVVHPEVEEASTTMEGQFRIWCKTKPKKETFHALKNYLDTRFKPARISNQTKDQIVHGYIGVKLKEIAYKKKFESSTVENFLFQVCVFSPNGKILNSTLLSEYQRWKKSLQKEISDDDMKELKDYLNASDYVLKATVWTDAGSNEGYYGIMLKSDEHKHKKTSTTGKSVEKRLKSTNDRIGAWETIAKAAEAEKMSAAKMSRSIKNNVVFNDEYYYAIQTA